MSSDELEALRKENRLLSTRLGRSEINRTRLEAYKERNTRLYRSVIEEMHETHRRLEDSERRASAANKAKSSFLANMSHELRTPLNAVIGYTELVLEEGTDLREEQRRDLNVVLTAAGQLLRLIDSVLDLSKIEAERVELVIEECAVSEIVDAAVVCTRPAIEHGGNRFLIDSNVGSVRARTDRHQLSQILLNLLSNAGKFCSGGVVTLVVRADEWHLNFTVEDTGIGMTPDQLGRVFEPFVQADGSTTRRYGGTGLGLTLAQRFAELLGGSLLATSEIGRGSRFDLRVPRQLDAGSGRP